MYDFDAFCGGNLVILCRKRKIIDKMRRFLTAILAIIVSVAISAQMSGFRKGAPSAATWSAKIEMTGKKSGKLVLTMTPSKGWHIYGFDVEPGGPKAMTADFDKSTGVKFKGDFKPSVAPTKAHDEAFDTDVTYWSEKVVLTRDFTVTDAKNAKIVGVVGYQGCNDETCSSPQRYNVSLTLPTDK